MSSNHIIHFSDFEVSGKELTEVNEGALDFLTQGLGALGDGFVNMIKQKVIAYVLEYLKIREKSPLSKLIQEIFEEIDVSEYIGIISGKHANWDFFVPKIAEGFIEFLQRSGFDEIAESLGIESDGYLYSILREALAERISKRKDFKQDIEDFLSGLFKKSKSPMKSVGLKSIVGDMNTSSKNGALSGIKKSAKKLGIDKEDIPNTGNDAGDYIESYIEKILKASQNKFAKAVVN